MSLSNTDLEVAGYQRVFDYTNYSHLNHVNVIPEEDFKRLVEDTFATITKTLRATYGPYASTVMISEMNETVTTKDGFNVFSALSFSHAYKHKVYIAIKDIIDRVNRRVGDGTTSCILLAEKIFKQLESIATTPDQKVALFKILNVIEKELQSAEHMSRDKENSLIRPLGNSALYGLVNLAGNYDDELTRVIIEALDPECDSDGNITSIRNVVVESHVDRDGESTTSYEVDLLPGNYRVRAKFDKEEWAMMFYDKMPVRVAIYDHAFSNTDWNFFMHEFDKETFTILIARSFNRDFLETTYTRYSMERRSASSSVKVIPVEIKGSCVRDEIADLAAVLNTKPIGLHAAAVQHETLPLVPVQVYKGNCMCFFTDYIPKEYIEALKYEQETDTSDSLVKKAAYKDRIRALSLKSKDTLITVKSGTSLELKVITDKIADCVSIVESALEWGIVPNSLAYGYNRINFMINIEPMFGKVVTGIKNAIKQLFFDIWVSKFGRDDGGNINHEDEMNRVVTKLFDENTNMRSFDIINETFDDVWNFPTSAQYDIEVIVASISIVKYLLTSKAFMFDAQLMTQVNDEGRYQMM